MSPSLESTSAQALAATWIILSAYNLPRLALFGLTYVIDEMSTANLYARLRAVRMGEPSHVPVDY